MRAIHIGGVYLLALSAGVICYETDDARASFKFALLRLEESLEGCFLRLRKTLTVRQSVMCKRDT